MGITLLINYLFAQRMGGMGELGGGGVGGGARGISCAAAAHLNTLAALQHSCAAAVPQATSHQFVSLASTAVFINTLPPPYRVSSREGT